VKTDLDPRCHLVRQPGDRKVICGKRSELVGTGWIRWVGMHEVGRMFAGVPLPDWCLDCLLSLPSGTVAPFEPPALTLFD
jgi:hypothetical protein